MVALGVSGNAGVAAVLGVATVFAFLSAVAANASGLQGRIHPVRHTSKIQMAD